MKPVRACVAFFCCARCYAVSLWTSCCRFSACQHLYVEVTPNQQLRTRMCCHLETSTYLCVGALEGASSDCEALRENILVEPEVIYAMCDQQWICRKVKRLRAGFNGTRSCEDAMSNLVV
eukprot:1058553-Pleurochrysis_carterae.AAC.1